jgi:hypothetical protein
VPRFAHTTWITVQCIRSKAFAEKGIKDGIQVNSVVPGAVMTGRRQSFMEKWGSAHGMSVDKALKEFPEKAGIARYGERDDRGVDRRNGSEARLRIEGGAPRDKDHGAVCSLQRLPSSDRKPSQAVQLQRCAVFPLSVGHLKQIDLRHGAGDVYKGSILPKRSSVRSIRD